MRSVVNFVAFQIGWFAAVLGAGHDMPWLGVVIVPLVLLVNLALLGASTVQPTLDGHALGESGNNPEWLHGMVAWTLSGGCPVRSSWGPSRLSQRCEAWRGNPPLNPRSRHLGDYLGGRFPGAAGAGRVRAQALGCARGAMEKLAEITRSAGHGACPTHETIRVLPSARILPEEIMGDQPFLAAPKSPEFGAGHEEDPPALEP
jgi:hypothetical protein